MVERSGFINFDDNKSKLETCTSMPSLITDSQTSKNPPISQHLSISFLNSNLGSKPDKKAGTKAVSPKSDMTKAIHTIESS